MSVRKRTDTKSIRWTATWKAPKASYRLDAKRLEAEERAIYEKYKVASQVSRRFVLKDTSQARTVSH